MANLDLAATPLAGSRSLRGGPVRVSWDGNPWSLAGLCFLNILLIIVTLGIYWFWARSEYRRLMWQMVRVEGEPLEYGGTGRELFIGYLRLFLLVLLPLIAFIAAAQLLLGPKNPLIALVVLPVYLGLFFLYFAGVFRAHRYILSRTRWRGIAFGLNGNAAGYAWTSVWTAFLTGFTLGWIWPWRTVALRRRLTSAMYFGSVPFRYEGRAGRLYAPFVILWLGLVFLYGALIVIQIAVMQQMKTQPQNPPALHLEQVPPVAVLAILCAIPILLAGLTWYEARKLNIFARATKIGPLETDLRASGGSVLWLTLSNLAIIVFTAGILRPVAQARRLRYLVKRLSVMGTVDLDEITKGVEQESLQGAGLEAAFSIEIF